MGKAFIKTIRHQKSLGLIVLALLLCTSKAHAQLGQQEGYDDYGSFASDPEELDNEVSDLFGRFFQTSLYLGSGILTGGLGQAYTAGPFFGVQFTFYFDKVWGAELGGGYASSTGYYNNANTGSSTINLNLSMAVIPVWLGFRYGFDEERLPRGFAAMNPYLAVDGELFFRNETVIGTPTVGGLNSNLASEFGPGAIFSSSAFGVSMGGGLQFDVYKRRLLLGVDVRYHLMFWSDANVTIGSLNRTGDYITVLGTATYNY